MVCVCAFVTAQEEDAQRVQSAEDTATEQFMAVVDQAARKTEDAPTFARKVRTVPAPPAL